MNKFTTFYIVRHGETEYNVKRIMQGQSLNPPLNENGLKQAEELAKEMVDIDFAAIFSSDMVRARQTAEIIRAKRELLVNTSHLIRERNFGVFDGKSIDEFNEKSRKILETLKIFTEEQRKKIKFDKNYESDEEIVSRLITFLREVAVAYIGKKVLVVCHGGLLRTFLVHLGVGNNEELPPRSVTNGGYIKFYSDGTEFFVRELKGVNKVKI